MHQLIRFIISTNISLKRQAWLLARILHRAMSLLLGHVSSNSYFSKTQTKESKVTY